MTQLELFRPSSLMFAMTTKLGPIRLYDEVLYWEAKVIRERVLASVARATFCAKVEGFEYSRYPRR